MRPDRTGRAAAIAAACVLLSVAGCGGGSGGGNPTPTPASTADFRDEIVYQILTDRFADGDAANDGGQLARPGDALDLANPVGWHGGDFAGVRRKIEEGYFQRKGFTAIWISPVVIQVRPPGNGGGVNSGKPFVGFHGYWADRFDAVEPHFGDLAALQALGTAADGVPENLLGAIRWLRDSVPSVDGLRMHTRAALALTGGLLRFRTRCDEPRRARAHGERPRRRGRRARRARLRAHHDGRETGGGGEQPAHAR